MSSHGSSTVTAIAQMHVEMTTIGCDIVSFLKACRSPLTRICSSSNGLFVNSSTSTSHRNFTFDASRLQNRWPDSRRSRLQSSGTEKNWNLKKRFVKNANFSSNLSGRAQSSIQNPIITYTLFLWSPFSCIRSKLALNCKENIKKFRLIIIG